MEARSFVLLIAIVISYSRGTGIDRCMSPQYLELGKKQTIQCFFQDGFYAVAWYDSHDVTESESLIRLVNGFKEGRGYSSGNFDIQMNGSLVINNITIQDDHRFTALKFQTQDEDPVPVVVRVIVTVKPRVPFPVINKCEENRTCFTQLSPGSNLTCSVQKVRPSLFLSWFARIGDRDMELQYSASVTDNNATFTTRSTTSSTFLYSSLLSLLVCKANNSTETLLEQESVVFVENSNIDLQNVNPVTKYVERGSQMKLACSETDSLIVWKFTEQVGGVFRVLTYTASFRRNSSKISDDYELQSDGSLKVSHTETKHEGLYGCIFENEDTRGTAVYNVIVFVVSHPVVHGCTLNQYCVLAMQLEGTLTCSVTGIRPKVELKWRTFDDQDSSLITFTDEKLTTNANGENYDVHVTSNYKIQQTSRNRLTLECSMLGPNITAFSSTAKFDLLINNVQPSSTSSAGMQPPEEVEAAIQTPPLWVICMVILFPVAIILTTVSIYKIRRSHREGRQRKRKRHEVGCEEDNNGEAETEIDPLQEMLTPLAESHRSNKKGQLISELKETYGSLYNAIQPIPYVRDRLYCVDNVFVESPVEYLVAKEGINGRAKWERLPSHHSLFYDSRIKSKRFILEGEPGYGKSVLTLQLAYDWCNQVDDSYLKEIDILIVLRLRQLRDTMSIFAAIRRTLLPRDSVLTEDDVEKILMDASSVVVVLDGFDEYVGRDGETNSDIISIFAGEMFRKFEVILTTRSSCLPNIYPPLTERIRLMGFDERAQDNYLQKAVVGPDDRAFKKVKQQLTENPILRDLCEIPLFFVLYAHMHHESECFHKCNSVTNFFLHVISCLHSHMKNKLRDKHVIQYYLYENEHKDLDKVAFEGLSGKFQKIVWRKDELCKRLGDDFYDQYVRTGILVEEEILNICESSKIASNIQYENYVRFSHKLFCEWYAAHYLADYASSNKNRTDDFLKRLDPFDLQYTYRFACGLNLEASKKIVGYLRSRKETEKFAILCMLEQSENGLDDVKYLCSGSMSINANDSLLLQWSTVRLLSIASSNKISISSVCLTECYRKIDLPCGNIHLKSNLSVPVLTTLRELRIEESGTELSNENMHAILQYSFMCSTLEELWFYHCLLPRYIPAKFLAGDVPRGETSNRTRPLNVYWGIGINTYYLNLKTGYWQRPPQYGSAVISDEDYARAVKNVEEKKR